MATRQATFSASEAAAVAALPVKAVHKIIDADLRPSGDLGAERRLVKRDLLYVTVMGRLRRRFKVHPEARDRIRSALSKTCTEHGVVRGKVLKVDECLHVEWGPLVKEMDRGLRTLEKARRAVVEDPDVLGGEPVIRGTRIPVYMVATMLEQGADTQEMLGGYPSLSEEKIELARVYATAYPQRGRPKRRPWQ
jgi:uncharacterized protein (DUF433 family)